ncbi:MAG: hypothetical protein QME41_02060 [Actinomycetota bacterium]|nr:hypothetical protein [Actinomycetota bacterium]
MRLSGKLVSIVLGMFLMFGIGISAGAHYILKPAVAENKGSFVNIHTIVRNLTSDPVLAKAMNTNANYNTLIGTIKKNSSKENSSAELTVQQNPALYSVVYTPDLRDPAETIEEKNNGDKVLRFDKKKQKKEYSNSIPEMTTSGARDSNTIYPNWNGTSTQIHEVNALLHPEISIQGLFTRSIVTNKGVAEIAGRKATEYMVEPRVKKEQLDFDKIDRYEFFFDNETGILLRTVSYDGSNIKEEIYFEKIDIDREIDQNIFKF